MMALFTGIRAQLAAGDAEAVATDVKVAVTDGGSYTVTGHMSQVGNSIYSRLSDMAAMVTAGSWPYTTHPTPGNSEQMRGQVFEARRCHYNCASHAACHDRCPKPWGPIRQACSQLPAIRACRDSCIQDGTNPAAESCTSCPRFTPDWINDRLDDTDGLDYFEARCLVLEAIRQCHHDCRNQKQDRWECHSTCPSAKMFARDPKWRPGRANDAQEAFFNV